MFTLGRLRGAEDEGVAAGPPVPCAVIGAGRQGKAILRLLAELPAAPVRVVCDNYEGVFGGVRKIVPDAAVCADYREVLSDAGVQAVFIATPTHLHRQIALDAVAAGKHVYCEAPLAATIEDARAIAQAGAQAKTVFQSGIQNRTNPILQHALKFLRAAVLDHVVQVHAQWRSKDSWYRAGTTPEREEQLNWHLRAASSCGLLGEVGVHQLDLVNWGLDSLPVAVQGSGAILHWRDDGRDLPDTVQCVFDYPGGVRLVHELTLANSLGGAQVQFLGSNGSIVLRETKGWLFKEADAPTLGWEVYARKDQIGDEVGYVLVADSTKLVAAGKLPHDVEAEPEDAPLRHALEGFLTAIRKGEPAAAGAVEGYRATVTAIRAHEAVRDGRRIEFSESDWGL